MKTNILLFAKGGEIIAITLLLIKFIAYTIVAAAHTYNFSDSRIAHIAENFLIGILAYNAFWVVVTIFIFRAIIGLLRETT